MACSAGKQLQLIKPDRSTLTIEHPSTVGGLSFSPDGRQIAVSHYGGVSVHWTLVSDAKPKVLKWTGSHLVTWSPDARFVLTSMQENCIRGWRPERATRPAHERIQQSSEVLVMATRRTLARHQRGELRGLLAVQETQWANGRNANHPGLS